MRVISQTALNKAFDRPDGGSRNLPRIIELKALQPFISEEVRARATQFIEVEDIKGFEATLLPEICEIWLSARDAGVLDGKQLLTAQKDTECPASRSGHWCLHSRNSAKKWLKIYSQTFCSSWATISKAEWLRSTHSAPR